MKQNKRKIVGIVLTTFLCFCLQSISVKATEIMPLYENTSSCVSTLSFSGRSATCRITIAGKSGTTRISGTLKLRDKTARKTVKKWTISKNGAFCNESKTATVQSGHKYKLLFTGTIYNSNGNGEDVSASVTKSN